MFQSGRGGVRLPEAVETVIREIGPFGVFEQAAPNLGVLHRDIARAPASC